MKAKIVFLMDFGEDDLRLMFSPISEKSCPYPSPSLPEIENGSLEINGNRNGNGGGYKPGSVAIYMCHSGGAHLVLVPLSAGKRVCHRGRWVDK